MVSLSLQEEREIRKAATKLGSTLAAFLRMAGLKFARSQHGK